MRRAPQFPNQWKPHEPPWGRFPAFPTCLAPQALIRLGRGTCHHTENLYKNSLAISINEFTLICKAGKQKSMAKPKSEDKRNAILSAATQVFAERGLSAPTAAITSAAGVAEGSLFTYFKTKDELINALYREIKLELADAMMSGFPRKKSVRHRVKHVWNGYVNWGVTNPSQQRVLKQIQVWGGLTEESKKAGLAPFTEVERMADDAVAQRIYKDIPQPFIVAALGALAEMTMEFMRQEPERANMYRIAGFEILWAGATRR